MCLQVNSLYALYNEKVETLRVNRINANISFYLFVGFLFLGSLRLASQSKGHMCRYLVGFAARWLARRNPLEGGYVVLHIVAGAAENLPVARLICAALAGRFNVIQLELERIALAAYRTAMVVRCQYRSEFVAASFAHVGQSQVPDVAGVCGHVLCLAVHGSHYARMSGGVKRSDRHQRK